MKIRKNVFVGIVVGASLFMMSGSAFAESAGVTMTDAMKASELKNKLQSEGIYITDTNYYIQDYNYKYAYPDIARVTIENHLDIDVRDVVVCYAAWDENGLPTPLLKQSGVTLYSVPCDLTGINIPAGQSENEWGMYVDPELTEKDFSHYEAIILSYVDFDGQRHTNPYFEEWSELYAGKKMIIDQEYTDSDSVQKVQELLNENGYECGAPDGKAGAATYAALNQYQQDHGLVVENAIRESLLVYMGIIEVSEEVSEEVTEETVDSASIDTSDIILESNEEIRNIGGDIYAVFPSDWYDYSTPTVTRLYSQEGGGENSGLIMYNVSEFGQDVSVVGYDGIETLLDTGVNSFVQSGYTLKEERKDIEIAGFQAREADMTKEEGGKEYTVKLAQFITGDYHITISFMQGVDLDNDYMNVYHRILDTVFIDSDGTIAERITSSQQSDETVTEGEKETDIASNEIEQKTQGESDIIASIENDYPIDIISVKMVRKSGSQDVIHIKIRKNFEMAGNDDISVKYITVNNDGENVCDYGSAWVSALDQGQASWAHGDNVVDEITYEDLSYIKITEIDYFKDNQSYCLYSLPESIKVYKEDIVLEEK